MTHPIERPAGVVATATPGGFRSSVPPTPESSQVRLRILVSYDGTAFSGWARQPGLRCVQGVLEESVAAVLHLPGGVRIAVAGRTDAGVHARGQVCHVDVPASAVARPDLDPGAGDAWDRLAGHLNGRLPADLRVRAIHPAPPGFDARWSASWRRYAYRVADPVTGFDPLTRGFTLWNRRVLAVADMDRAAGAFLGEHDFTAFCRARPGASSVRTVHDLRWRRQGGDPAGTIEMTVRADAFCHSMVRSLVGAFLAVGEGRWPVGRPAELLAHGVRVSAVATAPAHGLTLEEVGYPPDADLGAQALRSRRWRG